MDAHIRTLYGGVCFTVAAVCEKLWVPRHRQLAKEVTRSCHGCKRVTPKPKKGVVFYRSDSRRKAISNGWHRLCRYKRKHNQMGKAYLVLFSFSLARGVYLDLVPNHNRKSGKSCEICAELPYEILLLPAMNSKLPGSRCS